MLVNRIHSHVHIRLQRVMLALCVYVLVCPPQLAFGQVPLTDSPALQMPMPAMLRYDAPGRYVYVTGEIRQPGSYHVASDERVVSVLQRAGNVTRIGSKRRIEIRRGQQTLKVDLLHFYQRGTVSQNPMLHGGDVIYVPIRGSVVRVVGAVVHPGRYELNEKAAISDTIQLAGGLASTVHKGRPVQVMRFIQGRRYVATHTQSPVVLKNVFLHDGDTLYIPIASDPEHWTVAQLPTLAEEESLTEHEEHVFVTGGVKAPGPYSYDEDQSVAHYIDLAGGLRTDAKSHIVVVGRTGKKHRLRHGQATRVIQAGDNIFVPEKRFQKGGVTQLLLGIAGIALSTTVTILSLSR